MKKIYLTVDVECHDIVNRNQYIDGLSAKGLFGIKKILDLSKELNIPINFFFNIVENRKYGNKYTIEIINLIKQYRHNIYLHLHPEFITGDKKRSFLWEYSYEEKMQILQAGIDDYKTFLGEIPKMFRVGRYGADTEMYTVLRNMGLEMIDLSYCCERPKMCHISEQDLGVYNVPIMYMNQLIFPNTRYIALKIRRWKKFINLDTSDTTFNEWKRFLMKSKLSQLTLTMHSWNFIKRYFYLKKFTGADTFAEKKFKKMIIFAKEQEFEFCDLSQNPPKCSINNDEVVDLCIGIKAKLLMLYNNYLRIKILGRQNIKYFRLYIIINSVIITSIYLLYRLIL